MKAEWRNAEKSILALIDAGGHVYIVEPGHKFWDENKTRADISPYVPPPEPDPQEVAAKEVRSRRDALLTASDWTQVADAPVDQATWATYRQALRNLPRQPGFPHDVAWPTSPTSA